MPGILYLVPTPIGNLADISPRAVQTLAQADFIAAEDTRVSVKLLNHLGLKKPLVSYHEHNKSQSGEKIVERMRNGEVCALVTDAGSPAISDPGEDLVRLCAQMDIPVCAIPGPCALITALSISALSTKRFAFEGFLPAQKKARRQLLDSLVNEPRTLIFYEAPHHLLTTLQAFSAAFGGDRKISLCRELTKLHEQVFRTTLQEAVAFYTENEPRGEFVLIVEGAPFSEETSASLEDALTLTDKLIASGLSKKDAVRQAAKDTGFSKNTLYEIVIAHSSHDPASTSKD